MNHPSMPVPHLGHLDQAFGVGNFEPGHPWYRATPPDTRHEYLITWPDQDDTTSVTLRHNPEGYWHIEIDNPFLTDLQAARYPDEAAAMRAVRDAFYLGAGSWPLSLRRVQEMKE